METIILNHSQSKIDLLLESYALRVAYLLSETVVTAGTSYYLICYDHYCSLANFENKLRTIDNYHKNWEPEANWQPSAEEFKKTTQAYNKIKHHSPKGIIIRKQFEKSIDTLYREVCKIMLSRYMLSGLPQLQPVYQTDEFKAYPISNKNPETAKDDMLPASKLLQLKELPKEFTPPYLFFLTCSFFEDDFFNTCKVIENSPGNATDEDAAYLHPLITLPNLNLLSAVELQTLRKQLQEVALPFQEKINKWANMVKERNESSIAYLTNEVFAASQPLQECINNNELLKLCSRQRNDEIFEEILFGEMPVAMIWEYFRHFKIIDENTWQILTEAKAKNPSLNERWPVILFRDTNFKNKEKVIEAEKQEPVTAVKKSLIVD